MRWDGSAGEGDLGLGRAVNLGLESDSGRLSHIRMCTECPEHSLFLEYGEGHFNHPILTFLLHYVLNRKECTKQDLFSAKQALRFFSWCKMHRMTSYQRGKDKSSELALYSFYVWIELFPT